MKKYIIMILISFFTSITFLIFYNNIKDINIKNYYDLREPATKIKDNLILVNSIIEDNKVLFNKFPKSDVGLDNPIVMNAFNEIIEKIINISNNIKGILILDEEKNHIAGINTHIVDNFLKEDLIQDVNFNRDIINIFMDNNWLLVIRKIVDNNDKVIGKLVILFNNKSFNDYHLINYKDMVVFSSKYVNNSNYLVKEKYEKFSNIVTSRRSISVRIMNESIAIYKVNIFNNYDIYFVDRVKPDKSQQFVFYMIIISMSIFALSIVLIIINHILKDKKEKLERYNSEFITKLI